MRTALQRYSCATSQITPRANLGRLPKIRKEKISNSRLIFSRQNQLINHPSLSRFDPPRTFSSLPPRSTNTHPVNCAFYQRHLMVPKKTKPVLSHKSNGSHIIIRRPFTNHIRQNAQLFSAQTRKSFEQLTLTENQNGYPCKVLFFSCKKTSAGALPNLLFPKKHQIFTYQVVRQFSILSDRYERAQQASEALENEMMYDKNVSMDGIIQDLMKQVEEMNEDAAWVDEQPEYNEFERVTDEEIERISMQYNSGEEFQPAVEEEVKKKIDRMVIDTRHYYIEKLHNRIDNERKAYAEADAILEAAGMHRDHLPQTEDEYLMLTPKQRRAYDEAARVIRPVEENRPKNVPYEPKYPSAQFIDSRIENSPQLGPGSGL